MKLRKVDPDRPRIYEFPFKGAMFKVALIVPMIELIAAVIATVIPLSAEEVGDKVPMIIGLIVFLVIGEIFRIVSAKGRARSSASSPPRAAPRSTRASRPSSPPSATPRRLLPQRPRSKPGFNRFTDAPNRSVGGVLLYYGHGKTMPQHPVRPRTGERSPRCPRRSSP